MSYSSSKAKKQKQEGIEPSKLLMVIIALLLDMRPEGARELRIREKIQKLHRLGMRPVDIATILGKTQSHVNKELVTIKRLEGQKKEGGEELG